MRICCHKLPESGRSNNAKELSVERLSAAERLRERQRGEGIKQREREGEREGESTPILK